MPVCKVVFWICRWFCISMPVELQTLNPKPPNPRFFYYIPDGFLVQSEVGFMGIE